jgi:hypothetical protein
MSDKPEEPDFEKMEAELGLTPLDEDAFQMFEMFNSLLRAGFRERQALILVGIIINEANESEIYYVKDDEDPEEEGKNVA